MLIGVKHLSKSVGAKNLFKDISFTIAAGEKIALIGRNGYGKTTLLKILSGEDHNFLGQVESKKGLRITLTKQEHIHELFYFNFPSIAPGWMFGKKNKHFES